MSEIPDLSDMSNLQAKIAIFFTKPAASKNANQKTTNQGTKKKIEFEKHRTSEDPENTDFQKNQKIQNHDKCSLELFRNNS